MRPARELAPEFRVAAAKSRLRDNPIAREIYSARADERLEFATDSVRLLMNLYEGSTSVSISIRQRHANTLLFRNPLWWLYLTGRNIITATWQKLTGAKSQTMDRIVGLLQLSSPVARMLRIAVYHAPPIDANRAEELLALLPPAQRIGEDPIKDVTRCVYRLVRALLQVEPPSQQIAARIGAHYAALYDEPAPEATGTQHWTSIVDRIVAYKEPETDWESERIGVDVEAVPEEFRDLSELADQWGFASSNVANEYLAQVGEDERQRLLDALAGRREAVEKWAKSAEWIDLTNEQEAFRCMLEAATWIEFERR